MLTLMSSRYVGLSEAYTMDNFYDTLFPTGKLLTDTERKLVDKLNPDDSGPIAFHEVIAWALHDVIAQTSAQTVIHTGPQVLKKALESQTIDALKERAGIVVDEVDSHGMLRPRLIDTILTKAAKKDKSGRRMDNIEEWKADEVSVWINGIENINANVNDPGDKCGQYFQDNDIRGRELLRLTRQDIVDVLSTADSQSSKKVVARTKRILSSVERVRGDDIQLSDSVAHELIEMILSLRGSLTALYGFKNQPVSPIKSSNVQSPTNQSVMERIALHTRLHRVFDLGCLRRFRSFTYICC